MVAGGVFLGIRPEALLVQLFLEPGVAVHIGEGLWQLSLGLCRIGPVFQDGGVVCVQGVVSQLVLGFIDHGQEFIPLPQCFPNRGQGPPAAEGLAVSGFFYQAYIFPGFGVVGRGHHGIGRCQIAPGLGAVKITVPGMGLSVRRQTETVFGIGRRAALVVFQFVQDSLGVRDNIHITSGLVQHVDSSLAGHNAGV